MNQLRIATRIEFLWIPPWYKQIVPRLRLFYCQRIRRHHAWEHDPSVRVITAIDYRERSVTYGPGNSERCKTCGTRKS